MKPLFFKYFACFMLLSLSLFAQRQNKQAPIKRASLDSIKKEKDAIDLLHLRKLAKDDNIPAKRTLKPEVTVVPFVGYTLATRLAAILAGNVAFYLDDDPVTNQSAVSASISYSQNKQIVLPILSNIWTRGNGYNFVGNWRYYKYPEKTFGLGGQTDLNKYTQLDYTFILFREAILKHFKGTEYYAGIGYNFSGHFNIKQLHVDSGQVTDFDRYHGASQSMSSGISVHLLYDQRRNTINPPGGGGYASVVYCPYTKLLGGDNNWQSLVVDLRKYFRVGKKNVLAFWSYNWLTFGGNAPYLDLPSTQWDSYGNVGRGYIQSRLRGQNLLYLESEYRFRILHNGLLGGVVFANAQSVSDWPGNKFTKIYPAAGAGLRFKLNKYSGTNLTIDYAFGINGSRGLFINIGEAF